ncbi:cytochrome c oxidase assembly protein [Gordonia sp. NB41Y]|uniref:cytochrome c oxidase assembly protein n=1 Tax=Gordonia sp. NB41Y TaxID=875808 RepID=UPI0002BEC367|nr:cytochrome c oxidase assembly protein [Gordonia sp. NB41Y]EMP13286.1 copper resistance protein CopD [Gordonia sp. NB41Y]WLP89535.1 cytochrome c oxidase assembly protein [Gordonia sp. NB41Y]
MSSTPPPLDLGSVPTSWQVDVVTVPVVLLAVGAYLVCLRRSGLPWARAVPGVAGGVVWLVSACSFIGVYSDTLFWVRALQVVLLLLVVPFCLALAMPLTVIRAALGPRGQERVDAALGTRFARVSASPVVTSAGVIVTPWLIYLTGWYPAMLRSDVLDVLTRLLLVLCGLGYFYARLQLDPVPRRHAQSLTLLLSLAETIGGGVLGVVLWQGPIVAASYYESLHRTWGPSIRTDQTIGAGILWILGDVIGLPFLLVVFSRFRAEERLVEEVVDARAEESARDSDEQAPTLWWQEHPELRERFR